jgi:hypothetical protein
MPIHPIYFTDRLLRKAAKVEGLALAINQNSDTCPVLAKRQALRLFDEVRELSQSMREAALIGRATVKPPKARSA